MAQLDKEFDVFRIKFGKRVKSLREDKGLSLLDLGVAISMEKTAISRIENGRTNITIKTALKLSKGLEISLQELFHF